MKIHTKLDNRVGVIRIFPGMSRNWFESQLNAPNTKAIILETFGSGNAPSQGGFIELLQKAIDSGILVINITQCPGGSVEQGRYATSSKLAKMGVVAGADLTIEAALTKLLFLMGNYKKMADIKRLMVESLRGEMTV